VFKGSSNHPTIGLARRIGRNSQYAYKALCGRFRPEYFSKLFLKIDTINSRLKKKFNGM